MKKKYLLGLIPAVLLSCCIGPNWQVDLKRAIQVANGILAKQDYGDLEIPENFRYYTETFNITRNFNTGITESERNTYTFDIDVARFFFRYEYTQTAHRENDPAKHDLTTIIWYYFDSSERKLYDVSNLGTQDTRTYKVTELEEDEEFDIEKFQAHIKEILNGKDQFDYLNQSYLDPQMTQDQVDAESLKDGITASVKFYSRYDHAYSYDVSIEYDSYVAEDGGIVTGNARESYGWENYYYTSHSFTRDVNVKTIDNKEEQIVDTVNYQMIIFNNKTSVEFDYPELEQYKLIEEEQGGQTGGDAE